MRSLLTVSCLAVFWQSFAEETPAVVEPLRIKGLVAAAFTPFHEDGSINTAAVELQAAWFNATGVQWVFVSGTTGESLKLTVDERLAQAALWVKIAPRFRLRVIVHVGHDSVLDAVRMAQHAQTIGADAIGAHPSPGVLCMQEPLLGFLR